MMVLIDTSIWIEFFTYKPVIDPREVECLIEEGRATTCLPIIAEVLSGGMTAAARATISRGLHALPTIDPDWNDEKSWDAIVGFAISARRRQYKMPGIVDRMILITAMQAQARLWTLDQPLRRLARALHVGTFPH